MNALLHPTESAFTDLPDRLVVASAHGCFTPSPPHTITAEGRIVRAGEVIGHLESSSSTLEVTAPCDAWLIDYLVFDGERVRPGRPVVHLRAI